jgi:hypothetical protein
MALEAVCGGAQGIRNVLVTRQELEIFWSNVREQVKGNFERRLGIVHKRLDDGVILEIFAIAPDQTEGFLAEAGHGGKTLDFALAELRGLEHCTLHNLAGVADEQHALLAGSLECELDAFNDPQARDFLQERFAPGTVGLGGFSRSWLRCPTVTAEEASSAATNSGDVLNRSRSSKRS